MRFQFKFFIATSVLIFSNLTYAANKGRCELKAYEKWQGVTVKVDQQIDASLKALGLVTLRLKPRLHKVHYKYIEDNIEYPLVSAESFRGEYSEETNRYLIAIDPNTNKPTDFTIVPVGAYLGCLKKDFKENKYQVLNSSVVSITQFKTEKEYKDSVMQEKLLAELEADKIYYQRSLKNPEKRKIGAKLCFKKDDYLTIGYTERTSPDNDKIQIRIVNSFHTKLVMPNSGFQEYIIWDDPTKWDLCESR